MQEMKMRMRYARNVENTLLNITVAEVIGGIDMQTSVSHCT